MRFHEDWYSRDKCKYLAHLVKMSDAAEGRVVEIGCWEGRSTIAIANSTRQTVHAVDTWEGSPGEISAELAAERNVYAQFVENTRGLDIEAHRCDWRAYLADTSPIRFCHIDATHSYNEVRDNIEAVLPLLSPGAVICGDDAHDPDVLKAVKDVLPDAELAGQQHGEDLLEPLWWWQKPHKSLLARRYQEARVTPSDINEHLPFFVELCERLHARTVIELGTRSGVSTLGWLFGLGRSDGHLWSVDIDEGPEIDSERWTFLQGDDLDIETVKQLPNDADVVFIDTSHFYQQTLAELNVYRWKVRPGGRILLHDTELPRPIGSTRNEPRYPVKTAIEEFCVEEGLSWTNHPHSWGLGVIQIPE